MTDHIPVPSEHAPVKRCKQTNDSLTVMERDNPEAWIMATNRAAIREVEQ